MNLILSFSARQNGNCDAIAKYIQKEGDDYVAIRDLNIHACMNCDYECMNDVCKYRDDDIFNLYKSMLNYDKVFLVVPMYCGNPCSLYFTFNERCQDFFMNNDCYEEFVKKLYVIGIYGSKEENPNFISTLNQWFESQDDTNQVLGIERHKYNQKMDDYVLNVEEIKKKIDEFIEM